MMTPAQLARLEALEAAVFAANLRANIVATGAATIVDATFYQCTQPVLTGMLAGNFAWSGIVTASNGTTGNEAAFPAGNNVVLLVRMNAAHSSTTAPSNVSLSLLELPYH